MKPFARNNGLILLFVGVILLIIGLALPVEATGQPVDLHCPDHDSVFTEKVEDGTVPYDLNEVVMPAGYVICVKGAADNTGQITADGETTLFEYLGNDHDVSYVVIYEAPETTTTTTVPETTTTTVPETTTTTQPEVTTTTVPPPPVTTTTLPYDSLPEPEEEPIAPNEQNPPPPAEVPHTTLPFTGPEVPTGHLAGFALAALALGAALTYTTKENA